MVILFDQFNLPEDVFKIIFATKQQEIVAKLLINQMKQHDGELTKTEMSVFATALHDGNLLPVEETRFGKKKEVISYNKRQFYDRILTPMKTMGMIDYDLYSKRYTISNKLNKNLMRIGLMWLQEIKKSAFDIKFKNKDKK